MRVSQRLNARCSQTAAASNHAGAGAREQRAQLQRLPAMLPAVSHSRASDVGPTVFCCCRSVASQPNSIALHGSRLPTRISMHATARHLQHATLRARSATPCSHHRHSKISPAELGHCLLLLHLSDCCRLLQKLRSHEIECVDALLTLLPFCLAYLPAAPLASPLLLTPLISAAITERTPAASALAMSRAAATAGSTLPDMDAFANQPVVVDNGSGLIKAGFAGAEMPKLIYPA